MSIRHNNRKQKDMIITATKGFSRAVFTWNDDLTECNHTAIDISDDEFNELLNAKVHEGSTLKGWNVEIAM